MRTDERPTRLRTRAILPNFSLCVKAAKYIVTRITYDPKSMTSVEKSMSGIDKTLGTAVPQVAVFDTAFHSSLPPANYVYPGPYEWLEQGIR